MDPNVDMNQHHAPPPDLCANGCNFFGSAKTRGLCSYCYKAAILRNSPPPPPSDDSEIEVLEANEFAAASTLLMKSVEAAMLRNDDSEIEVSEEKEIAAASTTPLTDAVEPPPAKIRCDLCNRKLGVLGFACRCGGGYCNKHRLPEAHACRFDYKGAGKVVIEDQNPLVKADKMTRRI